jgi:hypothetical protein
MKSFWINRFNGIVVHRNNRKFEQAREVCFVKRGDAVVADT